MSHFKAVFVLGAALGLLGIAGPASATHKSWQLKNSGSQCFFTSYSTSAPPAGAMNIANETSSARYAVCPVTLAGRWGSSANAVTSVPLWAVTMSAKAMVVNNNTNGSVFDCYVRARLSTESIYYSSSATTTTVGAKFLTVAANNQWGGTLEAAQSNALRSMDFDCRIPGVPVNGSPSYIDAYQVKICQNSAICNDDRSSHEGYPSGGVSFDNQYNFVQTSGFECTVGDYHEANNFHRGPTGITNDATYGSGVFCPITQPSDDSFYHDRQIEQATVHYASPNGNTPIPSCSIQALSYSGSFFPLQFTGSGEFTSDGSNTVVQPGFTAVHVGKDVSLGVWCNVQAGQTIKGVTARLSETTISGGQ